MVIFLIRRMDRKNREKKRTNARVMKNEGKDMYDSIHRKRLEHCLFLVPFVEPVNQYWMKLLLLNCVCHFFSGSLRLPENGTIQIVYEKPTNSVIAYVRAYDNDTGVNAILTFSIVQTNMLATFRINAKTGEISLARPLSKRDMKSYTCNNRICRFFVNNLYRSIFGDRKSDDRRIVV
jgi:hypothetical protein